MRNVSDTVKQAVFAAETDELFITLLTLDHDDFDDPIRVNSSGADVTSNGDLYIAFPFSLVLPKEQEGVPPRAQLSIDNTDRRIVRALRGISS